MTGRSIAPRMSLHEAAQLVLLVDMVLNADADLHAALVTRYPAAIRGKAKIETGLLRAGVEKRGDAWVISERLPQTAERGKDDS